MPQETANSFGRGVMQAADIWVKTATSQNAYTMRKLPAAANGFIGAPARSCSF